MKKLIKSLNAFLLLCLLNVLGITSVSAVVVEGNNLCSPKVTIKDDKSIEDALGDENYRDKSMGNNTYCPVYCVEEDTFTFPGFKPVVASGEHFTWTIGETIEQNILRGLTVNLHGKRDCRTRIDLNKWLKDYEDLLRQIQDEVNKLERPSEEVAKNCGGGSSASRWCGAHKISDAIVCSDTPRLTEEHWENGNNGKNSLYQRFYEMPVGPEYSHVPLGPDGILYLEGGPDEHYPIVGRDNVSAVPLNDCRYRVREQKWVMGCPCSEAPSGTETFTQRSNAGQGFTETFGNAVCNHGYPGKIGTDGDVRVECDIGASKAVYKSVEHEIIDPCASTTRDPLTGYMKCVPGSQKWIERVIDYYERTVTVHYFTQSCKYSGGMGGGDLNSCQSTGLRKCPSGYHFAGREDVCYKDDVSVLDRLIDKQEAMLDILRECSTLTLDYVLDTNMMVDYDEPRYGRDINLIRTQVQEQTYNKENHRVKAADKKTVTRYICDLEHAKRECHTEQKDVTQWWNSEYGKEYHTEFEYTLPTEMYQYILLPEGESVDHVPSDHGSDTAGFQNYINVGYSNYPVDYATPAGLYDLDIHYWNVGYQNKLQNEMRTTNSNMFTEAGNVLYDCEYDLNTGQPFGPPEKGDPNDPNNPYNPPAGNKKDNLDELGSIRLIYRPISLVIPFPGADGSGREAGDNWDNVLWIDKYILNNRNVSGYDIYNQEPMYQITLNPNNIREIRSYNRTTTYDDYNLECVKGRECKSDFIREPSVGFSQYITGCGTGNWNDCDKQDGYTRGDEE